jgi:hypothetical protein
MSERYVWNARMPEWGYGLVRSVTGKKLDILFEHGGRRLLRQDFADLEEVDPESIDDDSPLHDRKQWRRLESQKAFQAEFGRMLARFLEVFPGGFTDPRYIASERDYKLKAIAFAGEHLTAEALEQTRQSGGSAAIVEAILSATTLTNLIHPRWERSLLSAIPEAHHDALADAFINLLHGADDYAQRLTDFARLLAEFRAGKWTIATYFGFLLRPDEHPFVKPDAVRYAAKALQQELHYTAQPNPRTWRNIVRLYADVGARLTAEGHPPADTIDIQTFLWVGGPGYEQASVGLEATEAPAPVAAEAAEPEEAAEPAEPAEPAEATAEEPAEEEDREVGIAVSIAPAAPAAPRRRRWTDADHGEVIAAYFWMQDQERQSRPLDRGEVYEDLETGALAGHDSQEIRRAMLHVSAALVEIGRPHLRWLAPPASPDADLTERLVPLVRARLTEARKLYAPTELPDELLERSHAISVGGLTRCPPGRRHPEKTTQTVTVWRRDPAVRAWVIRRAASTCEHCGTPSPYVDRFGAFLQLFNPRPFSAGGSDTVENTAAICPNCLHLAELGFNRPGMLEQLYQNVSELVRE